MAKEEKPPVIIHPFPPVYDSSSEVLVLGSFPSVKSREENFYYAHPRNRFWPMLETIYRKEVKTAEEKEALLHQSHIALYDSIYSCRITGSSDSAITDITPASLLPIIQNSKIKRILCNGTKSYDVYMRYCFPETDIEAIRMPSTSPANAQFTLPSLIEEWSLFLPSE